MLMYSCVSEMNGSNDTREGREELRLFCYYKVLTLSISTTQLFLTSKIAYFVICVLTIRF